MSVPFWKKGSLGRPIQKSEFSNRLARLVFSLESLEFDQAGADK
jgi:hypothetical protein